MFPFIFHYNDIYIPTFFFMIMISSMITTYYLFWKSGKKKMSQVVALDMAIIATIMGFVGGRLFHVFFEYPAYYWEDPVRIFYVWQGGFVGYGSFIGILVSALLYLKIRKLPILEYADLMALACPLIIFFVRIGCIGAGCCYGKPTDFFIHLTFDHPASDAGRDYPGIPLHATQIYDMINAVITFILIHWVDKYKKFHGQVLLSFFASYAFFRFLIEYLRGDSDRGVYLNGLLSTSQITGLVIISLIALIWPWMKKNFPVNRT